VVGVNDAFNAVWREPRSPGATAPRRWDWALVVALLAAAVGQAIFDTGAGLRPFAVAVGLATIVALPWRRVEPLVALAVAFVATSLLDAVSLIGDYDDPALGATGLAAVVLVYSLFRWGSGTEMIAGVPLVLVSHLLANFTTRADSGLSSGRPSWTEAFVSLPFWLFPMAVGLVMRSRAALRLRREEQARQEERNLLARELHDTVAHHVSAIAIQAQAGQAVAAIQPDKAVEILGTIETAASATLTEMRRMVGALRQADAVTSPGAGVADIEQLADLTVGGPAVRVSVSGDVATLGPGLQATLFRLAQESVTNARRHARHATRVSVELKCDGDEVLLCVSDDGDSVAGPNVVGGFGLVGMRERVDLLGGTLAAGPGPDRGWRVEAKLPREGAMRNEVER